VSTIKEPGFPTPTDRTLRDLPSGTQDAIEIPSGVDQWHRFATSYKTAADLLADTVADDPWRHAMLGASMMFLYRHYVELHLKSLLVDAGELLDDPQAIPVRHHIQTLWDRVRALLLRISPQSAGVWFTRADEIIGELDSLDPTSMAFRYPVDRHSAPSLAVPLKIDARNVRGVMDEVHVLLDGASTQIDVYMDFKHDAY
jgi:hypothetical protein